MDADQIAVIIFVFLFFGGGTAVAAVFRSLADKRISALASENKHLRKENKQLKEKKSLTEDIDFSAEMEMLLLRVQQTDTVVPQLPGDLRNDIDSLLVEKRDFRRVPMSKIDSKK